MTRGKTYDYIIVGAGSAGCVLANRLSADPSRRVLLLEAGGLDRNFWVRLPVGYFRTIYDERFSRLFPTEPSEGTAERSIVWPRGRIVGGSSSINGLIFIRGQHEDFDDWAASGADGWSFRDVLPAFRRLESFDGSPSQLRGAQGELHVSTLRNDHPACRAWVAAAQETGLSFNADFNGESTFGVGSYQLTVAGRWRDSAATAFLRPALKRKNLDLLTGALVTRILFSRRRATGVEYLKDGRLTSASAGDVILSAGALQSPQILQLSGIGDPAVLKPLGIPMISDLPGVGQNLQDHYQARTIVRLKSRNSLNDEVRSASGLARMGWRWLVHKAGPLMVGAGQVGGAAASEYAVGNRPDLQFNVMPLSVDKPGDPLHGYSGFTASVWQCHPRSRGKLTIVNTDPAAPPRIEANYLSDPLDRKVIVAGVRMLRDIYRQRSFALLWDKEVLPGKDVCSDADILDFARKHGGTVFHQCGTCQMGKHSASVVAPDLRVHGADNLHVIDASVMPSITSANTNAPSLMIGERGAEFILAAR